MGPIPGEGTTSVGEVGGMNQQWLTVGTYFFVRLIVILLTESESLSVMSIHLKKSNFSLINSIISLLLFISPFIFIVS